ncbi:HdeD family acid-resistance protein [Actinoplanes sp. CA-131856]
MTEATIRTQPPDLLAEVRSQPFPWWAMLVTGVLGTAFGVAVLAWPDISLRIMALLVGIWLFMSGAAWTVGAFIPGRGKSAGEHVLTGIVGIVVLVGGLLCLRDLVTRLTVLALIFAVTWILSGMAEVIAAYRATGVRRAGLLGVGLLSIVAGLILLFAPGLSLTALVLLTGISSIVVGLGEIVLAFYLRRTAH